MYFPSKYKKLTCPKCGKEFDNCKLIELHIWEKHDRIVNVSLTQDGDARVVKIYNLTFKPTKKLCFH
jgi:hypothetical protein